MLLLAEQKRTDRAIEFVGILAPLVLLTGRLFSGPHNAPTSRANTS
ncbi:MAG: hypothetical protein LC790_12925 [Actinobacteria bacterium]|nr:hypothetical protein [Actinomycetota bacterium]